MQVLYSRLRQFQQKVSMPPFNWGQIWRVIQYTTVLVTPHICWTFAGNRDTIIFAYIIRKVFLKLCQDTGSLPSTSFRRVCAAVVCLKQQKITKNLQGVFLPTFPQLC